MKNVLISMTAGCAGAVVLLCVPTDLRYGLATVTVGGTVALLSFLDLLVQESRR